MWVALVSMSNSGGRHFHRRLAIFTPVNEWCSQTDIELSAGSVDSLTCQLPVGQEGGRGTRTSAALHNELKPVLLGLFSCWLLAPGPALNMVTSWHIDPSQPFKICVLQSLSGEDHVGAKGWTGAEHSLKAVVSASSSETRP